LARRSQRTQAGSLHRQLCVRLSDQGAQRTDSHQSPGHDDFLLPRRSGIQMNSTRIAEKGVAGVRLAASAQPPRATSVFSPRLSSSRSPPPLPPPFALTTNGARQESLGCCGLPPAPPEKMVSKTLHFPNV